MNPSEHAWQATWIEPAEARGGPDAHRPAYHLASEFSIEGPVASASLYATAHGIYEAFINGTRVGDVELTPGFTAYRKRIQVQTFDVTDLVVHGPNALGALLSDGWWRGQHGIVRAIDAYGSTTAFLAELHVTLRSGETLVFGTDGSWRSTPSHVLAADLIAGEVHDLRRQRPWLGGLGHRPLRVGRCARRGPRLRGALRSHRAAGAARRGAVRRVGHRDRGRTARRRLRSEQQRLGAPRGSRRRRHDDHVDLRRSARPETATSPRRTSRTPASPCRARSRSPSRPTS